MGDVVESVITESAEPIYVNERRDTVETKPEPRPADRVARERGLRPLRLPALSQRFVPLRAMSARKLAIASLVIACISIGIAVTAVLWARSVVAEVEQSAR